MPLIKKTGNDLPEIPTLKVWAQMPSKNAAMMSRQKFAAIPPTARVVRFAQIAERENKMVVRKAGNMGPAKQVSSPFPLTPALSPRERENHRQSVGEPG